MIQEAYVSFEVAKLLKKKGFSCSNSHCYYPQYHSNELLIGQDFTWNDYESTIVAPTQQMAMRWLREVHSIHIIAEPCLGEGNEPNLSFNRWFWTILKEEGEYKPIRKIDEFSTYEQACEEAIKYCLEKLI
jgi:hypothetical protein